MEPHLFENHDSSEGDRYDTEETGDDISIVSKRQKISTFDKKTRVNKNKVVGVSKTSLAAISPENIKLVYLKKSVVRELLTDWDTFESKVVGSFVKVKSDPYDTYQKNTHQLQLVTGVKKIDAANDSRAIILRLSNMIDDVTISVLSDANFSEEECNDLHRRVKEGLLKHPSVGELEQKVVMLHQYITKHWLARELVLLKNRIDQANEKGWRHLAMKYKDKRKLLLKPEEQSRLLNEVPRVLPEKVEPEAIRDDPLDDDVNQSSDDSPIAADWDWYNSSKVSNDLDSQGSFKNVRNNIDTPPLSPEEYCPSETEQARTEYSGNSISIEPNEIQVPETDCNSDTKAANVETHSDLLESSNQGNVFPQDKGKMKIITLSDGEDELDFQQRVPPTFPRPESFVWYYLDPYGKIQGPFSLITLKRWSGRGYFSPSFKVWIRGQTQDNAVLLKDVLQQVFPS